MTDISEGGELVALASVSAVALFTDEVKYTEFYQRVRAETVDNAPPADTTTAKGRDAIKARAFKVTKAKTALAKTAKDLTEKWRTKTNLVNASRKKMVEELEALADEVRAPVTQWELAEKHRTETVDKWLQWARDAAIVHPHDTANSVKLRGLEIWEYVFVPEVFAGYEEAAETAKHATVATLVAANKRLTQEEADRAELAALRAEREAREAREAEEARLKAEADRLAQESAAEAQRVADAAAAQAAAIQKAKDDAAAEVRREAEAEARQIEDRRAYARQIIEHIKQVGLGMIGGHPYPYVILIRELEEKITIGGNLGDMQDEVRTIRDITLQNVKDAQQRQAERAKADEVEAVRQEAQRDADAKAADDAKRAANRAHVSAVMSAAKQAVMRCGVDEPVAKLIVLAIKAGEIPAVKMEF